MFPFWYPLSRTELKYCNCKCISLWYAYLCIYYVTITIYLSPVIYLYSMLFPNKLSISLLFEISNKGNRCPRFFSHSKSQERNMTLESLYSGIGKPNSKLTFLFLGPIVNGFNAFISSSNTFNSFSHLIILILK